jgi:hypothetical protein
MLDRKGGVWGDRYHRHDLTTPREVHRVLTYVFNNHLKHGARVIGFPPGQGVADPYSSAPRFRGWERPIVIFDDAAAWPRPRERTWLLAKGWRVHGPVDPTIVPGRHAARATPPRQRQNRGPARREASEPQQPNGETAWS